MDIFNSDTPSSYTGRVIVQHREEKVGANQQRETLFASNTRMTKFVLVVISLICFSTGLLLSAPNGRIVGGGLARPGQLPYVVSITEDGCHICGGFIYSLTWIVTAASCVVGKPLSTLHVVVGQLNLINPDLREKVIAVIDVSPFPEYDSTNKLNDITLVKLAEDIVFDYKYIDFIEYSETVNHQTGVVMGWGSTVGGGNESVDLRCGGLFLNDFYANCSYSGNNFNVTTMICATPTTGSWVLPGSACTYDEGSPLVQEFVDPVNASLIIKMATGIFSKTESCEFEYPGIYTRLSFFSQWLLDTAGQQPERS